MLTKLREFSIAELLLLARVAIEATFWRQRILRGEMPVKTTVPAIGGTSRDDVKKAQRLGRIVNIAVWRTAGPDNCLLRSLMLGRLLARRGIPYSVRFGALASEPFALAHAWVEVDGMIVNDTPVNIARYVPFRVPQRTSREPSSSGSI